MGTAHADEGLKQITISTEPLSRSVKTLNDRGPVHGTLKKSYREETGSKFSFSDSTESNKAISRAVHASANIGAEVEGISAKIDSGFEETVSSYMTTIKTLTTESSKLETKEQAYEFPDGTEGYVGLVTDSVGGFSNSYYTQNSSMVPFSSTVKITLSVDYTPTFRKFMSIIMQVRRDVRDNGSAWDSLYNAANYADQHDNFLAYCDNVATFNDGMDNASWRTLAASANEAKAFYQNKEPRQAVVALLRGFTSVRSPSKNGSQWAGLAAAAQNMINEING
jgi:hypothetical protein